MESELQEQSAAEPSKRSRTRRFLFISLSLSLGFLLSIGLCELLAMGVTVFRTGRLLKLPHDIRSQGNAFALSVAGQMGGYMDTLHPHPYLAHVHRPTPGSSSPVNNIGLFGRDMPSRRDESFFTILVTGGSVACQVAGSSEETAFLEREFRSYRAAGTGRPIRVINGADGAWKQPQQAITVLLYHNAVDAVVTLDGFNEHYCLNGNLTRMEIPSSNYQAVSPLADSSPDSFVKAWWIKNAADTCANLPLINRLHCTYYVHQGLVQWGRSVMRSDSDMAGSSAATAALFSLPADWSPKEREDYNFNLYREHIRSIHYLLQPRGIPHLHLLQPVPALYKALTDKEKAVVGDLGYVDVYRRVESMFAELRAEGIPTGSLLRVFETTPSTVYADPIHCVIKPGTRPGTFSSTGYKLMAQEIARQLSAAGMIVTQK